MLLKIIFTVLTLITVAVCLGFSILGIVKGIPILIVACSALAVSFGLFSYTDARYWISYFKNRKNNK